jgi:hypothetical protein
MEHFIIDTDMGNDVDDALAIAVAHALQARGVLTLDSVILSRAGHDAAAFCAALNTFYGCPDIPVGVMRSGLASAQNRFLHLSQHWPHRYDPETAPDALPLLRQRLQALPDGSVTLVQIGFATNTAALLRDPADVALIQRKVKQLSVMAGAFVPIDGDAAFKEFNVMCDIPAMQQIALHWPTAVIWNGFEVGNALRYPHQSIEHDFGWTARHPVVEGYRAYCAPDEDRQSWDLVSVLFPAYPDRGYVDVSEPGRVTVADDGATSFVESPSGQHRVLQLRPDQQPRLLEALVQLVSQPR